MSEETLYFDANSLRWLAKCLRRAYKTANAKTTHGRSRSPEVLEAFERGWNACASAVEEMAFVFEETEDD